MTEETEARGNQQSAAGLQLRRIVFLSLMSFESERHVTVRGLWCLAAHEASGTVNLSGALSTWVRGSPLSSADYKYALLLGAEIRGLSLALERAKRRPPTGWSM